GGGAVEGDLHVHVATSGDTPGPPAAGRQPGRHLGGDPHAVGGELDADLVGGGVVDQLPEVGPDRGLPAADVDVEHLHALELVDDGLGFGGAELGRIPPPELDRQWVQARLQA